MGELGVDEDTPLESKMVSRQIERRRRGSRDELRQPPSRRRVRRRHEQAARDHLRRTPRHPREPTRVRTSSRWWSTWRDRGADILRRTAPRGLGLKGSGRRCASSPRAAAASEVSTDSLGDRRGGFEDAQRRANRPVRGEGAGDGTELLREVEQSAMLQVIDPRWLMYLTQMESPRGDGLPGIWSDGIRWWSTRRRPSQRSGSDRGHPARDRARAAQRADPSRRSQRSQSARTRRTRRRRRRSQPRLPAPPGDRAAVASRRPTRRRDRWSGRCRRRGPRPRSQAVRWRGRPGHACRRNSSPTDRAQPRRILSRALRRADGKRQRRRCKRRARRGAARARSGATEHVRCGSGKKYELLPAGADAP